MAFFLQKMDESQVASTEWRDGCLQSTPSAGTNVCWQEQAEIEFLRMILDKVKAPVQRFFWHEDVPLAQWLLKGDGPDLSISNSLLLLAPADTSGIPGIPP
jgi:hypothetical protein